MFCKNSFFITILVILIIIIRITRLENHWQVFLESETCHSTLAPLTSLAANGLSPHDGHARCGQHTAPPVAHRGAQLLTTHQWTFSSGQTTYQHLRSGTCVLHQKVPVIIVFMHYGLQGARNTVLVCGLALWDCSSGINQAPWEMARSARNTGWCCAPCGGSGGTCSWELFLWGWIRNLKLWKS